MDRNQMAYRCPDAEELERARLCGYRLTFASAGSGSGFATIFPETGSCVEGVLWLLTGVCEQRLDIYEGYPEFYEKRKITVKNKEGRETEALVYIMTESNMLHFNSPGQTYLNGILKGCRQHEIPTEVILEAAGKPPVPKKKED